MLDLALQERIDAIVESERILRDAKEMAAAIIADARQAATREAEESASLLTARHHAAAALDATAIRARARAKLDRSGEILTEIQREVDGFTRTMRAKVSSIEQTLSDPELAEPSEQTLPEEVSHRVLVQFLSDEPIVPEPRRATHDE